MISGWSRDGRKGIGLGFDGGVEMMEETEFEEGEAYSYDNNKKNDSTIDPDVSLSYLDEKLYNVLGHFQRDFEGGVSAENLGSRFGGYGSFLPTYQISPSWSHPRTPPEANKNSRQVSPNNLLPEGGRQTTLGSSSTSLSGRFAASSARSAAVSALKAPQFKGETNSAQPTTRAEDSNSKGQKVKKRRNASDPKSLKLRIKVGPQNLSTQKNAEIYSGLGLDVSPSSSLDGSPIDSEGVSRDLQVSPDESPTSILQIMTSHPMRDTLLLSPLSDELISLTENEKLWGKCGYEGNKKASLESLPLANGTHYANGEVSEARKLKACDKNSLSKGKGCANENDSALLSKKEIDIDGLACEELVSKALKLPLLSNPYPNVADPPKDTEKTVDSSKTATKGKRKEASSEWTSKKSLLPVTAIDTNSVEGSGGKISSSRRTMEIKGTDCNDHSSGYLKKEGQNEEEKADASSNNGQSKDMNVRNVDAVSPLKQSSRQKSSSNNEDGMKLAPEKELFASRDTMKPKGNQCHNAQSTEVIKEGSVPDSFIASKGKKTSSSNILLSKSEPEDMKKNLARDKYKEFFGDVELELEDAETGLEQIHSKEMLKGSDVISKKRLERDSSMKDKVNGRKTEKPFASAEYPRLASDGAPHTVIESNPAAPPGAGAPVVKEDWVCCDKCQTWRILPLGTDPDSLPKKWVCKLQTWLPGLNRCGVSEEETTMVLRALYQVPMSGVTAPAADKQYSEHEYPGGALSGPTSIDTSHASQEHQKAGIQTVDAGGKKIYGLKGVSSAIKQEGLLSSNGVKRNRQGTPNSRSSNGTTNSPSDENGHQLVGLPSSSIVEKQRPKQKEKRRSLENHPDGGIKNSKMRNTSETDLDGSTAKKFQRDYVHNDYDPIEAKPGQSSSTGLSGSEKVRDKYKYKQPKVDSLKNLAVAKNPESHSLDGSIQKCDSKDSLKRKWSECQNPETQPPPDIIEETYDNGRKKEKKAKVSKSVGKDSSRSGASGETDVKGRGKKGERVGQDLYSTVSQRSADAEDSPKRDLSALQPSVAATSSSSKVSGSHKNRTSLQEPKSSPVESVSSSPLRISKKDLCSATKRNPNRKEEHKNANSIPSSTPRWSSYGENDRCSNRSGIKKEESSNGKHHGMESAELDYHEKDVHDVSGGTIKEKMKGSDFATPGLTDVIADPLGQANQYAFRTENSDQSLNNERRNNSQFHNNGSISKDEKVLFSQHKEKNRTIRSDSGKCKTKDRDISNESSDQRIDEGKLTSGRNKVEDKSGASSDRLQQGSKKDSFGELLNENVKGVIQSKFVDGAEVKLDVISGLDKRQAALIDRDDGRSSRKLASEKTQQIEVLEKGKSHLTSPSIRGQNETVQSSQPVPAFKREGVANLLAVDVFEGEMLNASRQGKKSESHPGNKPNSLRQSTPPANKARAPDARSPIRKDSASQAAANAIKEATNLKHLADRLKNSVSSESTSLYFQATLKFLHGASLLESCNDSAKHSEMNQSRQIYSSTAKLCEFVAHEYERLKDMAAVSLAYKCMEVAYLRVIYSSNFNANRYRNELQTALQIFPPGESPSSSASDVDNLNNPTIVDKVTLAKGVASPQVAGTHVVSARNRASFTRLFNFAQEVYLAMEASRKSRVAFAAAYPGHSDTQCKVPALSVKKALDFSFHDVDNFLRLVRIAMEAISR
ncbi:cysteine-tryptophan domain-containing zinc finger protein 7 [Solanum verrucosum]|uniref:cysteine-tryptophan domain-containing zinc finger protein 7 n=1 Tax=Solanum verrucosum TaxID=315347 RepID=UPI0020D191B0|nr:cysteine-tryptophan domain-containing zinc finger protein 7 [Solanum verrucosum]XP_049344009.1 cysteine-tryptophan domain-containing zinc finger protein 7 [Solanum verrucosum]